MMVGNIEELGPEFSSEDFVRAMFNVVVAMVRKSGAQEFRMKVENGHGDFVWVDSSLSPDHGVHWLTAAAAPLPIAATQESAHEPV